MYAAPAASPPMTSTIAMLRPVRRGRSTTSMLSSMPIVARPAAMSESRRLARPRCAPPPRDCRPVDHVVVVFVGRRVAAHRHLHPLRRLGLRRARDPRRGRGRAIRLVDQLEERAKLVHVAEPARSARGRRHAIVASDPALDDPLLQRGRIAEAVSLPLLGGQQPRRPRRVRGQARRGRRRGGPVLRDTTNVCPQVVHCTEAPRSATLPSSSSYSVWQRSQRTSMSDLTLRPTYRKKAQSTYHGVESSRTVTGATPAMSSRGRAARRSSQTLREQGVQLGRRRCVRSPHHQVPQVVDAKATVERAPQHDRRRRRGADHRAPPGQRCRDAVDQRRQDVGRFGDRRADDDTRRQRAKEQIARDAVAAVARDEAAAAGRQQRQIATPIRARCARRRNVPASAGRPRSAGARPTAARSAAPASRRAGRAPRRRRRSRAVCRARTSRG